MFVRPSRRRDPAMTISVHGQAVTDYLQTLPPPTIRYDTSS